VLTEKIRAMSKETKKCCICGKEFTGWGNDPWPVKEDGECCMACNYEHVVPARIRERNKEERYNLQCEIDEIAADNMGF
jgi:hypothetical protein